MTENIKKRPEQLDYIFRPRSISVIGATPRKGSIGREILHNLITYEFNGKIFPVNPNHSVIHSIKAYSSILDVPDSVDLAVIVVPREYVSAVVDQCGEKGVKGLVVITAGFREVGPTGLQLEQELIEKVDYWGMRMIGPNCFGIINSSPNIMMDATFSKIYPKSGKIGFLSQSGALGEAILAQATEMNLGLSMFASIGNKANITGNDLLEYWKDDPDVEIILMYLENFGNPRRFTAIAREVAKVKPIVAVKSGTTTKGAAAASSHTGALAGAEVAVDALFEQTGVLRVSSIEELFDAASALAKMPVPKGNRVSIVTNAGGPGVLATDALINLGMEMPEFSEETKQAIRPHMPPDAPINNPLDLVAGAGPKEFKAALEAGIQDPNFDSMLSIFVPPITINQMEVAEAIVDVKNRFDRPLYACFMGVSWYSQGFEHLKANGVPAYIFPESIAHALARIDKYRRWRDRDEGVLPSYKVDGAVVRRIIKESLQRGEKEIVGEEALAILNAYGIAIAPYQYANSAEEAIEVAGKAGYPVVMKVNTPKILHKTEFGAVRVDLRDSSDVTSAWHQMEEKVRSEMGGHEKFSVVVQKMVKGGVETAIGMSTDPAFGPLIMFGLGGVYVEIMKDVSFRVNPVTDMEAREMVESCQGYKLLTGFRGSEPVDLDLLTESILRLSMLVTDFHEIDEFDVNPFIIASKRENTAAVDARFIVRPTTP
ncbi:MAG: acetate--CoA ligase family protein [candidate division Zixibacteria bacterium]|nr:acetate--CoA ligase family protein [candidate division Zixibacteria bacterium]MBU1471033.1 acetate--CoA ligase family protein [candidate division Zixibacteria bacterium]MBU2625068.1 acetate--CoA ligase family protein [candidate division Zixibacteria bacterium]